MKAFIQGWANFVVERRLLVILATSLLILGSFIPMKKLYFDNSNEMWFVEGDPALVQYDSLIERFGDNEYFLIGLEARPGDKNLINREALAMINGLTNFLENHPSVTKVTSLTKYQSITSQDDVLTVDPVVAEDFEDFEDSPENLARIEAAMGKEDLVHYMLITPDLRHSVIQARVEYKKGTIDHHVELVRATKDFIQSQGYAEQGFHLRLTGTSQINEEFFSSSMKDQQLTLPLMFLLIVVFLFVTFRSLPGTFLPLLVIVGSVILTLGSIGLSGWAMNMLNVVLPIMLMAVGVGDSVHILTEFYHYRAEGMSPKDAARQATIDLWVPCFNTSLTTAIGFLSIAFSRLQPLREFGLMAALGVSLAFVISVTSLPAFLSFVKAKPEKARKLTHDGLVARMTAGLSGFTYNHSRWIVGLGILITGISLWSASQVIADSNYVNYFKEGTSMRQDIEYFDHTYKGGVFLDLMVDSGSEGGVKDPQFLARALELQDFLEAQPETGKVSSMINFLRKMNQAMHNNDPAWYKLPDSRDLVAQYLLMYSNSGPDEDLSDLKTFDESILRISPRIVNMSTTEMRRFVERVEREVNTNYKDLKVEITGIPVLYNNMDLYIQQGLVTSFSIAFGSIILCFFLLLRSVKYGFLAMIPSLFPIIFAAGLMGALEIRLNFATMVVAAITFGIAVDDTIHILSRYIKARNNQKTRKEAIHKALTETGRALIFTSVILYVGFSILILSTFVPNIHLGFFAGVILAVALVASLTLLPAVMFLTGDKKAYAPLQEKSHVA